jgi:hypothetical protein
MNPIKNVLTELLGLFVDDDSLVVAVIALVLSMIICLRSHLVAAHSGAVLLFLGIAVLLAENVARSARAHVAENRNS